MAVVLQRTGPAPTVHLASGPRSATYPNWRPVSVGLETTVRSRPGIVRIEVRLKGSGIARLCSGSSAATTCTLYEPAWQGRTLQLVTYTKSGSVRLRLWEIPGTGRVRPAGPTVLSGLSYLQSTSQ